MIARKVFDAPWLRIWLPRTLYPVPCPAAYRGAFFANAGQGGPLCAQVSGKIEISAFTIVCTTARVSACAKRPPLSRWRRG
jgi:hypothetical protein